MSPNECTTFPPDGELAPYRATNDTDPALSVNHIYGGNLVAVPTGCPYSGTHSFVYGNRVETAGRYPSPLRVGAVGEVCTMARTEIAALEGAPKSFFVRSPSTATAGAVCHHQATISLLLYVLDSDAEQVGSVEGMGRWVEGNEIQSANRYLVIGEVIDGAVVAVEFTLHRYNHYAWGPVKREYNCIAHRIEVISETYLDTVGFVKKEDSDTAELNDSTVQKVIDDLGLMSVV
ncbi:hypothetical protein DFH08DRAFT_976327 [Mycena albidolilacea]|uniref:Uncharacterized protein n=1 Tax=Mycena albidolilacea TaxID=1033008 RepID=A0AAD6Z3S1_9AGAR|nr:hypothetical protein DFH08DRAFT_976327 [Mycena albidolilacea]